MPPIQYPCGYVFWNAFPNVSGQYFIKRNQVDSSKQFFSKVEADEAQSEEAIHASRNVKRNGTDLQYIYKGNPDKEVYTNINEVVLTYASITNFADITIA